MLYYDSVVKQIQSTLATQYTISPTPASPQYNLTQPEMSMLLGRMDQRIDHLRKSCDGKLKKVIEARNSLVQTTPAANFLACASWKCSSTYWQHFNKALTNATGDIGTKNDVLNDEDSIRGSVRPFFVYKIRKNFSFNCTTSVRQAHIIMEREIQPKSQSRNALLQNFAQLHALQF